MKTKRSIGELVEITETCEIGQEGERAVVLDIFDRDRYMTLVFPARPRDVERTIHTGADYRYLRSV